LCSSRFSHHDWIELGLSVPVTFTIIPRQCLPTLDPEAETHGSEHGVRTGA
jgi:hypothetical protein